MTSDLFTSGLGRETDPKGDAARQAVNALRGFEYQVVAAALAWLDLEENGRLYLEVAEDYATIAEQAIQAVQVKDTKASGSVTLNSKDIKSAIESFVNLVENNPEYVVHLRYFTTAPIGIERGIGNPFGGIAGLEFWQLAARPSASPAGETVRVRLQIESKTESARIDIYTEDGTDSLQSAVAKGDTTTEANPHPYFATAELSGTDLPADAPGAVYRFKLTKPNDAGEALNEQSSGNTWVRFSSNVPPYFSNKAERLIYPIVHREFEPVVYSSKSGSPPNRKTYRAYLTVLRGAGRDSRRRKAQGERQQHCHLCSRSQLYRISKRCCSVNKEKDIRQRGSGAVA